LHWFQDARTFSEEEGLIFAEVSAKTGMAVHEVFMTIGKSQRFLYQGMLLPTCHIHGKRLCLLLSAVVQHVKCEKKNYMV
jgi:hypothetical protein